MALAVGPVVHGANRILSGSVIFAATTIAASALVGVAISQFGLIAASRIWTASAFVIAALFVLVFVFRGRTLRLPGRQMPRGWVVRDNPILTAARFGAIWGTVFGTPIRGGSVLVLALAVAAIGRPDVGALYFAVFASARTILVLGPTVTPGTRNHVGELVVAAGSRYWLIELLDVVVVGYALGALWNSLA